jgi:hypothetical protein
MTQGATDTTPDATADQTSADTATDTTASATTVTADTSATDADAAALGDAGKKALDAMKADRKKARDEAAAEKARADALQAKLDGTEAEHTKTLEAQRVKDDALAAANNRILSAEVRAAAAGKLNDPADALAYIDLSSFEVGDDGSVDTDAIGAAVSDLISKKPYLAAQGGRFQGSADGGARNDASRPAQLSESDMARMSPEQKVEALEKGQFDRLLGRT